MTHGFDTAMRVLVVSACSKRKLTDDLALPTGQGILPARERYAGRAHIRIRNAVDRWRSNGAGESVAWSIVSAGYGLVDEHSRIPAYEATFTGLGVGLAGKRALDLGIPAALQDQILTYDVAVFVLPLLYLQAVGAPFRGPGSQMYFTSPAFGRRHQTTLIVPCGTSQARELRVAAREVAAVRFTAFVDDAISIGLAKTLRKWGSKGEAK
ncbi:MAG: hypothetical protein OXD50_09315 [Chloroflexi bacterium]|nr:hypothetical protein [Chloroflexota bacterium]